MWMIKSLVQLEEEGLVQLGRGKVISKKDLAANVGSYPVYSSSKVEDGKFGEYGLYMFDEELITWSVDGGGRLFHREKHKFSITNVTGFLRILDTSVLSYKYLFHALCLLHSKINFDWVKKAHPSVLRKEYLYIPIPPLAEQQRIVAKLDAAFAEIENLEKSSLSSIEQVAKVRQRRLIQTFHELYKTTQERKLEDVCISMHQGLNTQAEKIALVEDGIPLLQTRNIQSESLTLNGQLNYLPNELWEKYRRKYAPKHGDVFFTNRGTIGKTAICDHEMDVVVHWNIFKLTPDEKLVTPEFLLFSLQYLRESGYFVDLQKGTTVSFVSTKMMKNALVPCPNMETQKIVCKVHTAVEGELARLELLLEKKEKAISHLKSAILTQELQPPQSEAA